MRSMACVHPSSDADVALFEICRDERCDQIGIHAAHAIEENSRSRAKRRSRLGWLDDPFEQPRLRAHCSKAWELQNTDALDHAIISSVTRFKAKIFKDVYQDVLDTYGNVTSRTVYRRIETLVVRKRILRVTCPPNLSGYIHPRSRLDWISIQEQLADANGGDHGLAG